MQLKRENFEYHDDLFHVRITVRQVSLAESMERDAMRAEIDLPPLEGASDIAFVRRGHLMFTFPNCIIGTVNIENLDGAEVELSLDELRKNQELFFSLPASLVTVWENVVLELNPNFSPFWSRRHERSKKSDENGSKSNSSNGT